MINYKLLIAAPMLQDLLVNKLGQPLTAGIVTCYQDDSRTTLKNWYYQSGTPGNYTYIALPNPLTLSAAGTIDDINGNDTIPFFYPYSETDNVTFQPYYITVYDQYGIFQFSRAYFPYVAGGGVNPNSGGDTLENYIQNGRFWRNIGSVIATTPPITWTYQYQTGMPSSVLAQKIVPSQHDGFSMPDINFIKNIAGATDVITFSKFPLGSEPLENDITPEYYLNFTCSGPLSSGETLKCIQIPLSLHVKTLETQQATITLQTQLVSGTPNITLSIYQFLGSGVTSPAPIEIAALPLIPAWERHEIQFTFPSASGAVLGTGQDDAYYLQIDLPMNATGTCNINFALPSLYLSVNTPDNDFKTYDQIDTVINSPRTGDIRPSFNDYYNWGWVPLNDGTIGYNSNLMATYVPTTRNNPDTWPLYRLVWNLFAPYSTGSSTTGSNPLSLMFNSAGTSVGYGPNVTIPTTAISDWNANNSISLPMMMGRAIFNTSPSSALLINYSTTFTASNGSGNLLITTANPVNVFTGMPFYVTTTGSLPTGLSANTIYYAVVLSVTTFYVATTYINAVKGSVITAPMSAGTGCSLSMAVTGSTVGLYAQTQSISATPTSFVNPSIANNSGTIGQISELTTVMPSTFTNQFIKL